MSKDLFYNPTGGDFSNKLEMKSVEKLSYLNSIEGLYRYNGKHSIGVYYPVRTLPSVDIDKDAEWPIVMPAGTIVSVISIKDARAYNSDDASAGIMEDGYQMVAVGVDGNPLQKSINYMYPKDVAGLVVPANGGTQTEDSYTDACGENGILNLSGELVDSDSDDYVRAANKPIGIVNHRIFSDMRLRYLNYDARQSSNGNAISLGGVLTIPYIAITGGTEGDRTTVLNTVKGAVDSLHQYTWVNEEDEATAMEKLDSGEFLMPDQYGKFTKWNGTDDEQKFAKVIELRNRVPWNLDEVIDSFPGSGMKGTDTGGLTARLYHFITSILSKNAIKDKSYAKDKENVKKVLYEALKTDTGDVKIQIGQVDVAFGIMK